MPANKYNCALHTLLLKLVGQRRSVEASAYFYRVLLATQKPPSAARERARHVCLSVWLWFQEINGLTTAVCPEEGQEKNPIKLQLQGVNVNPKHTEQRYDIYLRLGPHDV